MDRGRVLAIHAEGFPSQPRVQRNSRERSRCLASPEARPPDRAAALRAWNRRTCPPAVAVRLSIFVFGNESAFFTVWAGSRQSANVGCLPTCLVFQDGSVWRKPPKPTGKCQTDVRG